MTKIEDTKLSCLPQMDTFPLFGHKEVIKAVEKIVSEAHLYRFGVRHPHPFLIELDKDEGRRACSRYITDRFKEAQILRFGDSLEDLLEYELDGTPQQMYQVFADITITADFANEYHGMVTFDLTELASHEDEYHIAEFINRAAALCRTAGVVFYISSQPTRREERLAGRLLKACPSIMRFSHKPYSYKDLAEITISMLVKKGIVIHNQNLVKEELATSFNENGIVSVKEAALIVDKLIEICELEGPRLCLGADKLKVKLKEDSLQEAVIHYGNMRRLMA